MAVVKTQVKPNRTYANERNADRAVHKAFGLEDLANYKAGNLRYFITWNEKGRCFPVFIGAEALTHGMHFHFNVVG